MESRRRADDDGVRDISGLHALNEVVERLAESALRVGHGNEGVGLVLEDGFSTGNEGVNDGNDSESGLESVLEAGGLLTMVRNVH